MSTFVIWMNRPQKKHARKNAPRDQMKVMVGEEMGQFKLGSTIVVCFEADKIDFADLAAEQVTRLGTPFATFADNQTQPD